MNNGLISIMNLVYFENIFQRHSRSAPRACTVPEYCIFAGKLRQPHYGHPCYITLPTDSVLK